MIAVFSEYRFVFVPSCFTVSLSQISLVLHAVYSQRVVAVVEDSVDVAVVYRTDAVFHLVSAVLPAVVAVVPHRDVVVVLV